MFSEAPILIAESNLYLSLDLSSAVEEMGGHVVGPASSVPEALTLLAGHVIAAAIIDPRRPSPGSPGVDEAAPTPRGPDLPAG